MKPELPGHLLNEQAADVGDFASRFWFFFFWVDRAGFRSRWTRTAVSRPQAELMAGGLGEVETGSSAGSGHGTQSGD